MKPTDKFKELIAAIAPVMKEHGFSRKGLTFYINHNGNYGLINFQKSIKSNASIIIFTVNIGVISHRLLHFCSIARRRTDLHVDDCHWRERLGFLLLNPKDTWWSIDTATSITQLARELCEYIVTLAIPKIDEYIQDEALRDLWLSGRSPGLTNFQRLMNLSVLVRTLGPLIEFASVTKELRRIVENTPRASVVEHHLRKLEQMNVI